MTVPAIAMDITAYVKMGIVVFAMCGVAGTVVYIWAVRRLVKVEERRIQAVESHLIAETLTARGLAP